ncbi:fibronectin type III domain-containing protein [Leptospira koniambonensis]|uniref:Fibronectin type III domain-containing protein n=1 Tax=Leptospira koniambonensis TaxID=2484950 RepID=A0A4R9JAT7_9LEPT|nr:fibronectin type III domain-containing protein [Leptospira koniambonensis]TGL35064.1 fibronectin type III domain-containing protein [Leptospira koniambonensis]
MFLFRGKTFAIVFQFILIFFSVSSGVFAEKKSFVYYIEWKEVKGSRGYVVEVRKTEPPQELFLEKKVSENEIEFSLEAGTYEYRIAALNRFGKPSSYTPWTNFKVEQDRPKAVALAEKEEASKGAKTSKFIWIPGTGYYSKGERWKSYSIWAWFGALAYLGNSERESGNILASKPLNDPMNIAVLSLNLPSSLTLYLWQARENDKKEYEMHQNNQALIGGVAILSVALSLWLENKLPQGDTVQFKVSPDRGGNLNTFANTGFSQNRWEVQYTRSF